MTTPPIYRPNLPTGTDPGTAAEFRQIGEVSRRVNERVAAVETDKLDKAGGTMTGPLLLADGAPATPALAFASDPDTGMYRTAADSLGLVTDGTRRVHVTTTGISLDLPVTVSQTLSVTAPPGSAGIEVGAASGGAAYIDLKVPSSDDYDLRLIAAGSGGALGSAGPLVIQSGSGNGIGYNSANGWHDFNGGAVCAGQFLLAETGSDTGFFSYADGVIGWKSNGAYKGRLRADGVVEAPGFQSSTSSGLYVAGYYTDEFGYQKAQLVSGAVGWNTMTLEAVLVPGNWAGLRIWVPNQAWDFRNTGTVVGPSGATWQADGNMWMPWANDWLSNVVYWTSDETLKENIAPADLDAVAVIDGLDFIQFDWSPTGANKRSGYVPIGVSAQQLQNLAPGLARETPDGTLHVDAQNFTMALAKALQETRRELNDTRALVEALARKVDDLNATLHPAG